MMNAFDGIDHADSQSLHQALYRRLMRDARSGLNEVFIAQMLASWISGRGMLPRFMGLDKTRFNAMLDWHFPHIGPLEGGRQNALSSPRESEREDVRNLLLDHRLNRSKSEIWVAEFVTVGCMASDHLWSDLGLFSRPCLTQMMEVNFPSLAALNTKNMKWKKFLYKQLCQKEGIYLCRAPSCEVCADYKECFIDSDE